MHPSDPKYDRLKLTEERIEEMTWGMQRVSSLETPLGKVLDKWRRPNGMLIQKVSVPIGVIGIIYEAPSQCHDRRLLALLQKRECVCIERRFGCRLLQSGVGRHHPRHTGATWHHARTSAPCCLPTGRLRRNCCKPSGWSTSSFRAAAKP